MRIVVTGGDGFIGTNLRVRLREAGFEDTVSITRSSSNEQLNSAVGNADFVFHLAGVNRPKEESEFTCGNVLFTEKLCAALAASGRRAAVVYASSTQAVLDNPYGRSKRAAEEALSHHNRESGSPVLLFRLPNVFGKWSKPNYNSAVATFCHQLVRGLPVTINDPSAALRLVYVDDVVKTFLDMLASPGAGVRYVEVEPIYDTTVGEVVEILRACASNRRSLLVPRVGTGLTRALYSTYVSFLPAASFDYRVPLYNDARGEFVEVLKTPDCGQFSYFTAGPGVTRGEHYHHSKTEKFVVVRGTAHFGFRHIKTGATSEIVARGGQAQIVETVPGWAHNITNIGDDELIVMLWANEIFDRARPDTVAMKVVT